MKNIERSKGLSSRKKTIARHFSHASDYDKHASIQQQVCQILINQIINIKQHSVLEVGAGTGQLTALLAKNIDSKNWFINELAGKQLPTLQAILPAAKIVIGDAESIDLSSLSGDMHSLIISANAVQWFDEPLHFIQHSFARLQSGGQLLFNTFTPDNFLQIKMLTGQGLDYPHSTQWQNALIASGFEQITLSTQRFDLTFENPYQVLKHMKLTGVSTNQTATSNDMPFKWTKSRLQQFETDYWQQFATTDKNGQLCVILTYDVLFINAVKP